MNYGRNRQNRQNRQNGPFYITAPEALLYSPRPGPYLPEPDRTHPPCANPARGLHRGMNRPPGGPNW